MSRASYHLDPNGKPIKRVWTPGEKRVEAFSSIDISMETGKPVPRVQAKIGFGNNGRDVIVVIVLGELVLPIPIAPDDAKKMVSQLCDEISKCQTESPPSSPLDSASQTVIETTTNPPGIEMPSDSITVAPGSGFEQSNCMTIHCASGAEDKAV